MEVTCVIDQCSRSAEPDRLNEASGTKAPAPNRHQIEGERIEQLTLNAWPGLRQFVRDGWLIRLSEGFTKRANSVQPLWGPPAETGRTLREKIGACEEIYRNAGLPAVFKITPFAASRHLDGLLQSFGYDLLEPSAVKSAALAGLPQPKTDDIGVERSPSVRWMELVSEWLDYSPEQTSAARRIMEAAPDAKGFFTLFCEGKPVACGMGVVEDRYVGLYEIVTNPECRNRGFGEQLLLHILHWGAACGADTGYLQVVQANAPAVRLYDKLGFRTVYAYWYRRRGCG